MCIEKAAPDFDNKKQQALFHTALKTSSERIQV